MRRPLAGRALSRAMSRGRPYPGAAVTIPRANFASDPVNDAVRSATIPKASGLPVARRWHPQ